MLSRTDCLKLSKRIASEHVFIFRFGQDNYICQDGKQVERQNESGGDRRLFPGRHRRRRNQCGRSARCSNQYRRRVRLVGASGLPSAENLGRPRSGFDSKRVSRQFSLCTRFFPWSQRQGCCPCQWPKLTTNPQSIQAFLQSQRRCFSTGLICRPAGTWNSIPNK